MSILRYHDVFSMLEDSAWVVPLRISVFHESVVVECCVCLVVGLFTCVFCYVLRTYGDGGGGGGGHHCLLACVQ